MKMPFVGYNTRYGSFPWPIVPRVDMYISPIGSTVFDPIFWRYALTTDEECYTYRNWSIDVFIKFAHGPGYDCLIFFERVVPVLLSLWNAAAGDQYEN